MQITGKHLIAGTWRRENQISFASHNPRTKTDLNWTFAEASEAEVNEALQAATAAFEITRNYPASRIESFLRMAADEIEALGDELIEVADLETGLGKPRLTGERGRTTNQLRAFADLLREGSYVEAIIDTALPNRTPAPRPDIRRMLVPIGPVAVFTPNNFPLAFGATGGDTASALAAGCPVILKGHPSHPATSELVASAIQRTIEKSDFPAGYFSLLQGASVAVGQALVKHPDITAIGFTGSQRGGRAVFDAAVSRPTPIPVYAEMGSVNPVVILPQAMKTQSQALADTLVDSVTLGAGQFCTNPGLVLMLDTPETVAFIEAAGRAMETRTPGVLLNAGVEANLKKAVAQTTRKENVTLIAGGKDDQQVGYSYANTILRTSAAAFLDDLDLQSEHFGPVTLFVVCNSQTQLESAIRHLEGNLTATIFANDDELELAGSLFNLLREKAGRLLLNGVPTGVEVVYAQNHGGPYPASSVVTATSVGMTAIKRWLRPVAFQNFPDALLPEALKAQNPKGIWRIVNGAYTNQAL